MVQGPAWTMNAPHRMITTESTHPVLRPHLLTLWAILAVILVVRKYVQAR